MCGCVCVCVCGGIKLVQDDTRKLGRKKHLKVDSGFYFLTNATFSKRMPIAHCHSVLVRFWVCLTWYPYGFQTGASLPRYSVEILVSVSCKRRLSVRCIFALVFTLSFPSCTGMKVVVLSCHTPLYLDVSRCRHDNWKLINRRIFFVFCFPWNAFTEQTT